MSSCCSFVFRLVLCVFLWIFKKTSGFNLKDIFSSSNGGVCSIECKGCRFLFQDVFFKNKLWNSILLHYNAPVRINYGNIGHFEFHVGWFLFGNIIINIKEINVLLSTTNERHYNYELETKKIIQNKQLLLRKLEQLQRRQVDFIEDNVKSFGRISRIFLRLLLILIRKIKIQVEEVHIRFEEKNTISDGRTSLGITVKTLVIQEDKLLRKAITPKTRWCTSKQFTVSMFSFYWNPDDQIMYTDLSEDDIKERLKMINYRKTFGHSYVLHPCSPSLCVTVTPGIDAFVKAVITCQVDSMTVNVSKNQLRVATILFGHINHLQNTIEFLKYRPQSTILKQPKQWWLYALKCIRLLQKSSKWDWLEVKEERLLKQKYSDCYSDLLLKKGSKKKHKKQLQSLEEEMSVLGTLLTKRKVERELGHHYTTKKNSRFFSKTKGVEQSLYSLSGQCNIGSIEVSLSSDSYSTENEEIDIFTVKVYTGYFALTKERQQSCITVTVDDVVCLGVDCSDGSNQERSSILACDKMSGKEVLSIKLVMIDNITISDGSDASHYNYHVSTHLHPTILHFDWTTVHRLAEFGAVVRGTHKDLREAVKARVKEVGRESKLRFQHFITNKERASIDANITLPVIVFDTPNTPYCQLSCHFGTLNVQTINNGPSNDGEIIHIVVYKVCLKDAKLSLSSVEITFDTLRTSDFCSTKDSNLLTFATMVSDLQYTTYVDSYLPSNLRTRIHCPEMYFGLVNGECEAVIQFCYDQFDFVVKTMNAFKSNSSNNKSNTLVSSQFQSCFLPEKSYVLQQLVAEEDADFRSKEDSKIFECEASLDLVRIRLKESETGGPHILLAVCDVVITCQLHEQATHFNVNMSSLQLIDHTHKDEYNESIKVLLTETDFLNFSSCFADPEAHLFSSQYKSIENSYKIELNPLTCSLHYEFLNNLLVWISEVNLPPFKSLLYTLLSNENEDNETDTQVIEPQQFLSSSDTVQSLCTIIIHLITVTLDTSQSSSLLTATLHDVNVVYCDKYNNGTVNFSIERFVLVDGLIVYDSPYHVVIANTRKEPLVNLNVCYELGREQVFIKCEANFGSIKIIYLHKLIRNLQIIVTTLLQRYSLMKEQCTMKLNSSLGTKNTKRSSLAGVHKSSKSVDVVQYSYQACINILKCSVKLPRDSHHPDALTLKGRQLRLLYGISAITTTTTTENVEEPDTDTSQYFKTSSHFNNAPLKATAQDIELNWNFGRMKRTVAKTNTFFIDRDLSCLIISLDLVKVFLSGDKLASVPGLISSNFSEKDPYAMKIIQYCSLKEPHPHHNKPVERKNTKIFSDQEIFDPFLKIAVLEWEWIIQSSDGIRDVTMATIELSNSTITVGSVLKCTKDKTDSGIAVKLCINNVSGTEGVDTDNRQKILTKYGLANSDHQSTNVLEVTVQSMSNSKPEVLIGLDNVCWCVWPSFLHCLVKFKKQIKLKEGRRGKWWRTRRRSTVATLAKRLSIISKPMFTTASTESTNSNTEGFSIRLGLESCCVAILENPSSVEVTTPGAMIQFQTNEQGIKDDLFQFEYVYTCSNCWSVNISDCWFHGNLCLFGENILPLTKVLPQSNLSLQYIVENTHDKLTITIPVLECHITNELFQVIHHFYETFNEQNHSLSSEVNMSLISDDIWSIKDFNRSSILPDIPDTQSIDEVDSYDDMLSSDDDDDNNEGMEQEHCRQQEAYIDLNDVTINFDLMTSGDRDSVSVICIHTCVHSVISQWSTQLLMDVTLTLESFIYNERRGEWEPLIEPIHNCTGKYKPYSLNIKLFQVFDLLPGEIISSIPTSPTFSSIHNLKDSSSIGSVSPMFGSKVNRSSFVKSSSLASDRLSVSSISPQSSPAIRNRHTQPARTRLTIQTNDSQESDNMSLKSNREREESPSMADDLSSISPQSTPNMRKRHTQPTPRRTIKTNNKEDSSNNNTGQDNQSMNSIEEQSSHSTYVLLLTSTDRLEVTITPSALKTIQMYNSMLGVNYEKSMDNIRNCVQDSRPPVRIENKTGVAIKVFPGPTFKEGDSSYSNSFIFHIRTLKHFPSFAGRHNMEHTDNGSTLFVSRLPQSSLLSIPESPDRSPSPSRLSPRRSHHSKSCVSPNSSEECIPLHFGSMMDTCPIGNNWDDDDSYCDNVSNTDDDDLETSSLGVIPIVEGSMFDVLDEGEETTDHPQSIGDHDDYHPVARQRKKSVCYLKLMRNSVTGETKNDIMKMNNKDDYWKPKLLRKTHKIKLQLFYSTQSSAIPIALPGVFAIPIKHEEFGQIALVCEVSFVKGVRKVVIKSGLQIKNSLWFQIAIYLFDKSSNFIDKLGDIGSGQIYDMPVQAVANNNMVLKFGAGSDGIPSDQSVNWKALSAMDNGSQIIVCPQSTIDGSQYFFQASIKLIPAVHQTLHSPSHIITLESAMVIHNHLPVPIDIVLQYVDGTIPSQLLHIDECVRDPLVDLPPKGEYIFRFSFEYFDLSYSGECTVNVGSVFKRTVKVISYDKRNRKIGSKMYFNVHTTSDSPHVIHIFAPYWIVNKTNIDLEFEHQPSRNRIHTICNKTDYLPLLLTYKSGRINEQHRIRFRVINGEWSKLFVLGAVGKIVNVTSVCRKRNFPYEFALETRLLDSTLTEIVYVMPKYSIVNYTDANLLCFSIATNGEIQKDTAIILKPPEDDSTCTLEPFWPGKYDVVDLSLVVGEDTTMLHSQRYKFSLSILCPTVIKTAYIALPVITVNIQPDPIRGTTVISIRPVVNVGAMVKIQNLCRRNCIRFMQRLISGAGQLYPLNPNQSILYTWDCPDGKREINWQIDRAKDSSWKTIKFDKPKQFGTARVTVKGQDNEQDELITVIWASAFEQSQLVLRFLDNTDDYKQLAKLKTPCSPDNIQFFCSLEGIGVSLVDNTPKEIVYFTITSSPVLWTKKRPKPGSIWTVINKEHSEQLETALRMEQSSITINDEKYDLDKMTIVSQKGGELCCSFNPGVWIWYSQCDSHQMFNVKLGKVQIDNQLTSTELPTRVIFSEVDSRYTGDLADVGVPFLDLQVSISMHGKNAIREYEKVLLTIKSCQVNMELGIIAALLPFANTTFAKVDVDNNYEMDKLDKSLYRLLDAENLVAIRTLNYVDALQINQTSVAVTYTTAGEYDLSSEWGKVINAIIHFALITQGSFKISLKSVQISNEVTDLSQMKRILYGHYKNEIFWQFQHFALGLDVIGNPAKLFNSYQTGAKDLVFKSREGISEGETGYGIALGMKSLLGHVVGGSANSVSLSTGTLSSMLLAATDLHYQREHRHMRQTREIPSIVLGGKFFLKGMFRGTTDIFVMPTTGAVNDGFEGFFKGLGRGTVSILVKPTLGLVDLAKYTMESVRSAVDNEMEVQTVRRPRLLHLDKEMKPYNSYGAEGLYILNHLSQPLCDEYYISHCWQPSICQKRTMVIMVTTKQLLQLYKADKQYCIEWSMSLDNIEKVQATTYKDEEHPTEEKPGLFLKGVFNKTIRRDKVQQVILRMETDTDVKDIKEKLQAAAMKCRNID